MTKSELLESVKKGLGNVPSHLDETLSLYIEDVIGFMIDAGVPVELLDYDNDSIDRKCKGCITRGVADLWNYGNGDTKLSDYFYLRCDQLRGESNG